MRTIPVLLLILLAAIAAPLARQQPAPGFADPVLGRWDLTVDAEGGHPAWLDIALRKETELMASFVGRFGSQRHASAVTYQNGELTVRIPVQYEQNTSDLVFKGRLAGDRLEGTTEDASGKTVKWTGVRAPALVRTAAPKWGTPIDLFNGKDVAGWKLRDNARGNCWSVADGGLTNAPPCVDLISDRSFTDFKLHLEFNIVAKSNSGAYLRGRYEVQINDDAGMASDALRTGGVYGFLRPAENAAGKPGQWQTYDITLAGRRATVVVNGRTVVNDAEIPGITGGALDSREGEPGPLMLQGDHGKIVFRKVVVTPAVGS
jgi:3-keto-disaccharide hydrolase